MAWKNLWLFLVVGATISPQSSLSDQFKSDLSTSMARHELNALPLFSHSIAVHNKVHSLKGTGYELPQCNSQLRIIPPSDMTPP